MKNGLHQPGEHSAVELGRDDSVARARVGGGGCLVIAGPCAVESREQLLHIGAFVAGAGAGGLRGGIFKPRTSPYSFRGLGADGLPLLAEAREACGLPVVTEVLEPSEVAAVADVADVLQIGARNMWNVPLLRAAAAAGRAVLLKRAFDATVQELVDAASVLLEAGAERVVLCERGIRTFETGTRFTLDLAAVPALRELTHLPVIVDPSHAAGRRSLVAPLALAAAAAGADGVMLEVHHEPARARSDGEQALPPEGFPELVARLQSVADAAAVDAAADDAAAWPPPHAADDASPANPEPAPA